MRRIGLVLAVLLLGSCAGRQAATSAVSSTRERQADEIIALDRQIQEFRTKLGLSPHPARRFYNEPEIPWSAPPMTRTAPECKDVCNLAEHICANKDDICRIADELPGDTWAKGKCDSAKASCNEAKERCDKCGK